MLLNTKSRRALLGRFALQFSQLNESEAFLLTGEDLQAVKIGAEFVAFELLKRSNGGKKGSKTNVGAKRKPDSELKPESLKQRERRALKENR